MSYTNAFITLAPDCPIAAGQVPRQPMSIAGLEHALLLAHPYRYTSADLIVEVQRRHKHVRDSDLPAFRAWLFAKSQPCMRLSMLPKRWGWGVHFDELGHMAIYGAETSDYRHFAKRSDLRIMPARLSRRLGSSPRRSSI
jgi:hypothetical protein